jgi:hypothetical protein
MLILPKLSMTNIVFTTHKYTAQIVNIMYTYINYVLQCLRFKKKKKERKKLHKTSFTNEKTSVKLSFILSVRY